MPARRPRPRHAAVLLTAVAATVVVTTGATPSYVVRTVSALIAIRLLQRSALLARRTRLLLGAALAAGIVSGLAATVHVLLLGQDSPVGGVADYVYLAYGPLAVAGLLTLPRRDLDGPRGLTAALDAALSVSALAILLLSVAPTLLHDSGQPALARAASLGFPVVAALVLTAVLALLPRVATSHLPFLQVAGLGLLLLTTSDLGYAVAAVKGSYTPTSWPAVAAEAGLLVLAAAAWTARRAPGPSVAGSSPFESLAPYAAVLPVLGLLGVEWVRGRGLSALQVPPALVLAAAALGRQLLAAAEHQRTIIRLVAGEQAASATARRDPLTGLGNRRALQDVLAELLAQVDPVPVTLVLLDLDDFKVINDTHGHDTGDAVLCEVGLRLASLGPVGTVVVRLGGDEFALCVRSSGDPQQLGDALAAALDVPVNVGTRAFRVSASIGVVQADAGPDATPAIAMSHADVAMYEAKGSARTGSTVVVLAGADREAAAVRVRMRDEISQPDLTQFRVVYEPVVDLLTGAVTGAEALLRWQHPVLGPIGPAVFVPLAEQVGAIGLLGEFALRTALGDLAGWLDQAEVDGVPLERAAVGVNLSPRQLADPGLIDLVARVLDETGLAPHRLILEITEEALLEDWALAVDTIGALRRSGVAVAVDDFGTGYSSLRYLRRFQASTLKVDLEFVQAVEEPRTRLLVSSVLEMARSLSLYTVAEGIETPEQLRVLRAEGCQFGQGYLFDRPLERDAFGTRLLSRHRYPVGPVGSVVPVPRTVGQQPTRRATGQV